MGIPTTTARGHGRVIVVTRGHLETGFWKGRRNTENTAGRTVVVDPSSPMLLRDRAIVYRQLSPGTPLSAAGRRTIRWCYCFGLDCLVVTGHCLFLPLLPAIPAVPRSSRSFFSGHALLQRRSFFRVCYSRVLLSTYFLPLFSLITLFSYRSIIGVLRRDPRSFFFFFFGNSPLRILLDH